MSLIIRVMKCLYISYQLWFGTCCYEVRCCPVVVSQLLPVCHRLKDKVTHVKIHGRGKKYDVGGGKQFDSIEDLIEYYKKCLLVDDKGIAIYLYQVCPTFLWLCIELGTNWKWLLRYPGLQVRFYTKRLVWDHNELVDVVQVSLFSGAHISRSHCVFYPVKCLSINNVPYPVV